MKKILIVFVVIIALGAGYYFLWENPIYATPPREGCDLVPKMFSIANALSIGPRYEIVNHNGRSYICPIIVTTEKKPYTAIQGKFEVSTTNAWRNDTPADTVYPEADYRTYSFYNHFASDSYVYRIGVSTWEGNTTGRLPTDAEETKSIENVSIGNGIKAIKFISCDEGTIYGACSGPINYLVENKNQAYWIIVLMEKYNGERDVDYSKLAPEHQKVIDEFLSTFKFID